MERQLNGLQLSFDGFTFETTFTATSLIELNQHVARIRAFIETVWPSGLQEPEQPALFNPPLPPDVPARVQASPYWKERNGL